MKFTLRPLAAALAALFLSPHALAGDSSLPADNYANDPRSSAAINVEIAKKRLKSLAPAIYGPAGRFVRQGAVNNPAADTTAQDTQSETTVLFMGNNKLIAGFNDSGSFIASNHFTGVARSSDGGVTWTDGGTLPNSAVGDAGDPVLARRAADSSALMVTLGFSAGTLQVFKSMDAGATWGAPVNGSPGFPGTDFHDKPWMTVDNNAGAGSGNVYLCWTRFGATEDIFLTRSTDGGATFGPNGGTLISNGGQGCFVVVSPNHKVSVFFYRGTGTGGQGGDNKLWVRHSTDAGVTFGSDIQVADLGTTSTNGNLALKGGLRSNSFPHAAVNKSAARPFMYVVYNDDPTPLVTTDQNADVNIVRSTDGGATWSAPAKVSGAANDQFFPTIGFSSTDNLMVGYYNRLRDPNNLYFQRFGRIAKLSATGVPTFNPAFQIGPSSPITIGQDPVINSTYMGDYDQIVGTTGKFFTTWSDSRRGNTFHTHQPDVYFGAITSPSVATNLALAMTSNKSTMPVLGVAELTLVTKANSGAARDTMLHVGLPVGLQFVSAVGANCRSSGAFVDCFLGDIATGTTKTRKISVRGAAISPALTVKASVTTSSKETFATNNSASKSIKVTAGTSVINTATTGNIAVAIPNLTTVEVSLPVALSGRLVSVKPRFRLDHTFDADLDIFLVSPAGTAIELSTDNGGGGDNYGTGANDCSGTPTEFDDAAATSITAGAAPFAGTFKPEGTLSQLANQTVSGTWKLRVIDDLGGDTGQIGCFSMEMRRVP